MADGGYILSRNEQMIRAIIDGTSYSTGYIQSRNEKILQAIIDGTSYDAEPQSRIEALLLHILNGTTTDVVPLSRNEAILTAIANGTEYTEEPQSRMEALLIEWLESRQAVEKTASGAVASFTTALAEPLIKCICAFMATQDLHGQSAPYPAGGGKNKANFVNGYGISISGEVEANLARFATVEAIPIKSGETYYVKKMQSGACSFIVAVYNGSTLVSRVSGLNSGDTIDTTGGDTFRVAGYASGSSVTFEAVEAMVVTDNTVTAYAPYENICPIVPVSSVDVTRTGKNLWNGTLINGDLPLDLKPNTTYTFSAKNLTGTNAYLFVRRSTDGVDFVLVERIINGLNEYVKTVTTEEGYIYSFWSNGNYDRVGDIQIEVETVETPVYEAYNGASDTVALGANYYGGNVDVVDGKITENYGIIEFDGSSDENWQPYGSQNGFYLNFYNMKSGTNQSGMCNCFEIGKPFAAMGLRLGANNTLGYFNHITDNIAGVTDMATWRAWLANNPVTVVYPLSTPTEATTSDTATLNTLQGQNNVFNNTGNTEVTYLDKP